MKDEELLENLQEVIVQLGIELRRNEGEFTGGIYRLKDQKFLLINSSLSTPETIRILCRELARQDLSGVFILPAVRERIDLQSLRTHQNT